MHFALYANCFLTPSISRGLTVSDSRRLDLESFHSRTNQTIDVEQEGQDRSYKQYDGWYYKKTTPIFHVEYQIAHKAQQGICDKHFDPIEMIDDPGLFERCCDNRGK